LAIKVGDSLHDGGDGRVEVVSSSVADTQGGGVVLDVLVDRLRSVLDSSGGGGSCVLSDGSLVLGVGGTDSVGVVVRVCSLVLSLSGSFINGGALPISVVSLGSSSVVNLSVLSSDSILGWLLSRAIIGDGSGSVRLLGIRKSSNHAQGNYR